MYASSDAEQPQNSEAPNQLSETSVQTTPSNSSSNPMTGSVINNIPNRMVIFVAAVLVVIAGIAYYLNTKQQVTVAPTDTIAEPPQQLPAQQPAASAAISQQPLFSGKLERLAQNLHIFKFTENDRLNSIENNFTYYSAGVFTQGEFKDYTRIIAIRQPEGPGQPLAVTLATKDFKTYVLDDPENKTTQYNIDDWRNPLTLLDQEKVTSTSAFDTELPRSIMLDADFSLYFDALPTESVETDKQDSYGNATYDTRLKTDYVNSQKLTSPVEHVTLYLEPFKQDETYFSQLTPDQKEYFLLKKKYFMAEAKVVAVDSVGLPATYIMTTTENAKIYDAKQTEYEIAWKKYQDQLEKVQNADTPPYAPAYVELPAMGFQSSRIVTNQPQLSFFTNYQTAFPGACSTSNSSRILKVQASDLEQIGTVDTIPVYRLIDNTHPLYTLAYETKLAYYKQDATAWNEVNQGRKKPTLEEYVNQHPLLFVKNYWQHWVALGEYDINLPGGCGKPVVYLYPTQPTDVTVKLTVPVFFSTDIPKYGDFWQVTAHPDGSLKNLKPELTDCQQIDTQKPGSEYARQACESNTYPYLYWAGTVTSSSYPPIEGGWIVDRRSLPQFLDTTVREMGLSAAETKDFTEYWLPEMLKKDTPYYRVSFLQTNDLNRLFPMAVQPQPDTVFRIFLDYTPLHTKPQQALKPQKLDKLVRNGFTLVEWGGLKQF